jgi:hypothetical protein
LRDGAVALALHSVWARKENPMEEHLQVGPGIKGCPFAMPAIPSTDTTAFYCRIPGGRVRIPTPEERARFCRSGKYYACPIVRRHVRDN